MVGHPRCDLLDFIGSSLQLFFQVHDWHNHTHNGHQHFSHPLTLDSELIVNLPDDQFTYLSGISPAASSFLPSVLPFYSPSFRFERYFEDRDAKKHRLFLSAWSFRIHCHIFIESAIVEDGICQIPRSVEGFPGIKKRLEEA